MAEFRLEMKFGQDLRVVEADLWKFDNGWIVFYRKPPQGGVKEYWRTQIDCVVSIETKGDR